jgi:DTW domain-containing protein YfiP
LEVGELEVSNLAGEVRQRCYQCFRPKSACFCEAIPQIDNRTNVLILQHVGERFHPFNTARIVQKALRNCHLVVDHNLRLGSHQLPITRNAGLLYLDADAPSLSELSAADRPDQLVIIDGTWHQAKTIVRDVPQLRTLPCYRLTPSSPGQYRIRREPNAQSLSTLEATVAALQALEPDTAGLEQLLAAFNQMVETQLDHPGSDEARRRKRGRHSRPRFIPLSLLQDPARLVVAYGEATPGQLGLPVGRPLPVNWVAHRIGTAERFSCRLHQQQPISETALEHMRLSAQDFDDALSQDEFRHQWSNFLRRDDVLIVYHQRTSQLLQHIEAAHSPCLVLKSIFGKWQFGFRSVEELMALEGLSLPAADNRSRATTRLNMAVALVEHLRKLSLSPNPSSAATR